MRTMDSSANDKIKKILAYTSWTQDQLAIKLGLPLKTVNGWITGRNSPRDINVAKINSIYDAVAGVDNISSDDLRSAENKALGLKLNIRELIENRDLRQIILANLTYHTDAIEGSTMTLADVTEVLSSDRAVLDDVSAREQVETLNHRAAFNYLLNEAYRRGSSFIWSEDVIKQTHLRLQNGLLETAGQYREYPVRVIGSSMARVNYASVPRRMGELVNALNGDGDVNLIDKLARTHADFELIHPFGDGNGRTGRLIMFVEAVLHGIVPPLVLKDRKHAYYKYLDIANSRNDYELLRLFIAESMAYTDKLLS